MGVTEFFGFVASIVGFGILYRIVHGNRACFTGVLLRLTSPSGALQRWRLAQTVFLFETVNALTRFLFASRKSDSTIGHRRTGFV
jgi:hypothetical protein